MKRWFNVTSQILALAGQMLIPALPLEVETKNLCHIVVGFVQGAISIIAHNFTPEGEKL